MVRTTTETGRLGEYLVAYHMEKAGYGCTLVDRRGSDIWCSTPAGRLFKLEVKTASSPSHRSGGSRSYSFQVQNRTADVFAFVALDREAFWLAGRGHLKPYVTHRFAPSWFTAEQQAYSFETFLPDHLQAA